MLSASRPQSGMAADGRVSTQRSPLVLGSASPRRRELLARLCVPFEVVVSDVDERPFVGESGPTLARRLARAKAHVVASAHPDAVVLAADTVVIHNGQVY